MKFLLLLIALLATLFPVPTSGVIYVGVFYNLALKSTLRSLFYSTNVLGTADNSAKVPAYDHITIYFNPSQDLLTNQYNARFGAIQTAHILGYAMDEHGQALLVSVDGPNAIQSDNSFPHVTISSSGSPGYSAVYSNDLWARIAASGFVTITNDTYGKPASIKWNLKNPAVKPNLIVNNTYQFTLPAYTGITKYNSTLAKVQLFQPSLVGILKGTFCASSQWNGQTGVCNTTAIGPVATTKPTVPPSGDFRTLSFQLTLNLRRAQSDAETVLYLANAMREVGDLAGIPRSHYIINNADIKRISGQVNSKDGKWQIKIGFRVLPNVYQDERQIFIKQLKICFNPTAVTFDIAAASTISAKGLLIDDADTESFIESNEVYEIQTCADGSTLSADQQCAVAITSTDTTLITSSSSSIPIATIVAPIIGGVVLLALIATVIIIRRRRPNAVKSMEGIARNTAALELNPPVTMTVTVSDRV